MCICVYVYVYMYMYMCMCMCMYLSEGVGGPPLTFRSWRRTVAYQTLPNHKFSSSFRFNFRQISSIFCKSCLVLSFGQNARKSRGHNFFHCVESWATPTDTKQGRARSRQRSFFQNQKRIGVRTIFAQKCKRRFQWISPRVV